MNDSADDAVPETGAARARPLVPAGREQDGVSKRKTSQPSGLVLFNKTGADTNPPQLERLFSNGSYAALAVCLFGFAWAFSSYFFSSQSQQPPARTIAPHESAGHNDMFSLAQNMAEDMRALKKNVEALRAAQSQLAKDTVGLVSLKTRVDAMKTETSASIAALAGKVERIQRDPEAKLSQIIDRLDRVEHKIAAPLPAGSNGGAPATAMSSSGKQLRLAEAKPPLDVSNERRPPQLITNWVVRDVYDGIALVESRHGAIEVIPGETIPGAGTVKSIERRGASWIVITSRGLVDSARDSFQP